MATGNVNTATSNILIPNNSPAQVTINSSYGDRPILFGTISTNTINTSVSGPISHFESISTTNTPESITNDSSVGNSGGGL